MGSSFLTSTIGRKKTMLLNNVFLLVGTLLQSCCKYWNLYWMFFIGRLVMGIQSGTSTSACPMYLSEIAPRRIRGGVGVVFQLSICLAILVSQILGYEWVLGSAELWPVLLNMGLVLGLIQCLTLPFCPESPRFLLISKEDRAGARAALVRLRGAGANIDEEMNEIIEEDRKEKSEPPVSYKDLGKIKYIRRPLIISCVMAASQQFSGINAIIYFAAPIFQAALPNESEDFPKYMVSVTGATNLVITGISVFTIDRLGRKKSHLIGLGGAAVCVLLVGILLSGLVVDDGQVCHGVAPTEATNYTSIVLIFIFIAFYGLGPGPVPWLITPELFTSSPRPKAMSIANTTNWLCSFTVALAFEPLRKHMCGWVFLIFFALSAIFIIYLSIKLPNIEGKSTTGIVELFKDEKKSKKDGDKNEDETTPIVRATSDRDSGKVASTT